MSGLRMEKIETLLLIITSSIIQLQNRSFHGKNDDKMDKNEKHRGKRANLLFLLRWSRWSRCHMMAGSLCRNFPHQLLHVNWYFSCVGVCFSWPNRCPDSSALASVSIPFHTQRSPLHCTCGKDRLRLTQFQRNANETRALNFVKFKETVSSIKIV